MSSTSIAKRSRSGVMSAFFTVATVRPSLDLHRVADAQLLLLDGEELGARAVLQHERVPDPQRLPVDLEQALAVAVFDPVVVADREHLLAHPVRRPAAV